MTKPFNHPPTPGESPLTPEMQELLNYFEENADLEFLGELEGLKGLYGPLSGPMEELIDHLQANGSDGFQMKLGGMLAFYKTESLESPDTLLIEPVKDSVRGQVSVFAAPPEASKLERAREFLQELLDARNEFTLKEWADIVDEMVEEKKEARAQEVIPPGLATQFLQFIGLQSPPKLEPIDPTKTSGHELIEFLRRKRGGMKRAKYNKQRILEKAAELGVTVLERLDDRKPAKAFKMDNNFFHYVVTDDNYCAHVMPNSMEIYIDPEPLRAEGY